MEIIVAVDNKWGIGYDNDLLIHIPKDLKNFKELTTNNTIVYGRNTLYSFKNKKPLPNRNNVILSRNKNLEVTNAKIIHSLEEILAYTKELEDKGEKVFVIGGEQIYNQLLPYCKGAYVTKIFQTFMANKHFPDIDRIGSWEIDNLLYNDVVFDETTKNDIEYTILHYKNNYPKEY